MEYEAEDLYENVVFRDSRIIYPLDLVARTDEPNPNNCDPPDESRRPRQSVLSAFDPCLATGANSKESNLDLISRGRLSFHQAALHDPPPIPPRNASYKVHQYDPVSFEDGKFHLSSAHFQEPSVSQNVGSLPVLLSSSPSSSNGKDDEFVHSCPLTPVGRRSKVRGLLNKVSGKEWLTGLKRLSVSHPPVEAKPESICFRNLNPDLNLEIKLGYGSMCMWNAGGRKDPQNLWTELKNGVIIAYLNQSSDSPVHVIKLEKLVSIGFPVSSSERNLPQNSYQFEIITQKERKKAYLSTNSFDERLHWMELILGSSSRSFFPDLRKCFIRAGKAFIKESVSADWRLAWILLQAHSKKLWIQNLTGADGKIGSLYCEDLRKIRSISQTKVGDDGGCSLSIQPGAPMVLNWTDHTLYLQTDLKSETDNWHQLFRVALQSGSEIDEYQLTADSVPVLVECCIKFIETYGVLSEGIYRRSGVQSKVERLLASLKTDAWNQHISNEEYTEHDVANVLKRFFRTLPEPLLTNQLYSNWIDALSLECHDQQLEVFKKLLSSLPDINRQTLRKLLGHLYLVQNKCEKNLMTVSNLAALWGPNLMTVDSDRDFSSNFSHTNAETDVVLQLIQYYPWLFDVDREKLAVTDAISEMQERIEQGAFGKKCAGDLRTWIKHDLINEDINFEIGPKLRVCDVVPILLNHSSLPKTNADCDIAILMEVVCNGQLQRPLNSKELLLPVILKWADWSEDERRNNQLVFCLHPTIARMFNIDKHFVPKSVYEVYYSNPKTRSFKQCPFEFCQGRFTLLKDLKNHTVQGRWNIEDIIWYLGSDQKQTAPTEWCITFIERDIPLTKGRSHFGHVLSFTFESDFWKFLKSVILTEFDGGISGLIREASGKN